MKVKKILYLLLPVLLTIILIILACHNPLDDKDVKNTILQVTIHDTPFILQGKTVEALYITIKRIDIIRSCDGAIITLLDKEITMDILEITANDPVVLSNVPVLPGKYEQLRLVLTRENTIVVDGEEYPIIIPSGEQTGVKLSGTFTIPPGKFFIIDLDFDAQKSVLYTNGQGYKLKPVIKITGTGEVKGIFRGNISLIEGYGETETVIELKNDNTYRLKISDYPNYIVKGNYYYNSFFISIKLKFLQLDAPDLTQYEIKKIMKKLPDEIILPITQWSLDHLIAIDALGHERVLYRVDSFDFSDDQSFTDLYVNIHYPDMSKNGKPVVVGLQSLSGTPPLLLISTFNGNTSCVHFMINERYFSASPSIRYNVTAYLFSNLKDHFNIEPSIYNNQLAFVMAGSYFKESTYNPWEQKDMVVVKKGEQNYSEIFFPKRLKIKMIPDDFTTNQFVISWDPFPGAYNGYFVLVLVKDKIKGGDDNDGNEYWDIAYSKVTNKTKVKVFSHLLRFVPVYSSDGSIIPPLIQKGEIIRIEVYVLDGSGRLNTKIKQGALFMDSLNITR